MVFNVEKLFDLSQCPVPNGFAGLRYPWDILPKIAALVEELAESLTDEYEQIAEHVWVGRGTTISPTAVIEGPAVIGKDCEIRPGAYLRSNVIIGNEVVIGNSTEVKNAILFNRVQAPHFNYVGDSVLGYGAHIGAGVILSNFKSTKEPVKVRNGDEVINTGLRKFGALLADFVEVGCNSVLNPGTVIGRESMIYPLSSVRGVIPEQSILKGSGVIVPKIK